MVGKAPGLIFCAHCGQPGAEVECGGCERQVCAGCAAAWQRCPVPHARALELGSRQQVDCIDGGGRFALVGTRPSLLQRLFGARSPHRLFDLTRGAPVAVPGPIRPADDGPVHVSRDGELFWMELDRTDVTRHYLCRTSPRASEVLIDRNDFAVGGGVTRDDAALWAIMDNLLLLTDLTSGTVRRKAGLPQRLAIQAADLDRPDGFLAIGTWGKLYLFRVGDKVDHCGTAETGDADVVACALRGDYLLAAVYDGMGAPEPRLYRIDGDGRLHDRRLPWLSRDISRRALLDVSPDGRWLAVAMPGGELALADLTDDTTRTLDGHGAEISFAAFDDDSSMLISADDDGRVIMRPLSGGGFATRVV